MRTHSSYDLIALRHEARMLATAWNLLKHSVMEFIEDNALSRGASIAFYTVTSIAPLLLIVIAIAGLVFGEDAARDAIQGQLGGLMGQQSAEMLQNAVKSASSHGSGGSILATLIGLVTLLVTASGVFGEMQATLNVIWKAKPHGNTVSRLLRARAASLGLVAALGFLLIVSLAVSAGLSAFGDFINAYLPFGKLILIVLNLIVSLLLISVLFAAIYKVLPDTHLEWHDVLVGAIATAALFTVGKSLIGWYIGSSSAASAYGAAGALIVVLLWIYYSAQIFLFGAEFTKVYAHRHGSYQDAATSALNTMPDGVAVGANPTVALPQRPVPAASNWGMLSAVAVGITLGVAMLRGNLPKSRL